MGEKRKQPPPQRAARRDPRAPAAARIGAIATGQLAEDAAPPVNAAASKRGNARAAKLTPARRKQIARKAARARWKTR